MDGSRIEQALARLDAAMTRIAKARADQAGKSNDPANSARVMALVNNHEKLREEVADTIGQLDALLEELEG